MLLRMNGSSRWSCWGATEKRWMAAGKLPPATIEVSSSRPSAIAGNAQPLSRMFTKKMTAQMIAANINRMSAGF